MPTNCFHIAPNQYKKRYKKEFGAIYKVMYVSYMLYIAAALFLAIYILKLALIFFGFLLVGGVITYGLHYYNQKQKLAHYQSLSLTLNEQEVIYKEGTTIKHRISWKNIRLVSHNSTKSLVWKHNAEISLLDIPVATHIELYPEYENHTELIKIVEKMLAL